jgi:hypothetical protein
VEVLISETKVAVAASAAAQCVYETFGGVVGDPHWSGVPSKCDPRLLVAFVRENPLAPAEAAWRTAAAHGAHKISVPLDGQSPWLSVPLPVRLAYETFRLTAMRLSALRDDEQQLLAAHTAAAPTPYADSLTRTFAKPLPFGARTVMSQRVANAPQAPVSAPDKQIAK